MKQASPLLKMLAVLFSVALLAAACGDDDSDDDGGGTETSQDEGSTAGTDETGTDEGGTAETGTDEGGSEPAGDAASADLPDEFFSEDCEEAYNAFFALQSQYGAAFTGQPEGLAEAQAQFDAMAEAAPDDVSDAFETFATEMAKLTDALAGIGLDGTAAPTAEQMAQLFELSETIDETALEQSGEEISAYFDEVCGSS